MEVFHSIHFRPVGQGLFVHGKVEATHGQLSFQWVYDCGADDLVGKLIPQIDAYADHNLGEIDLLIVSHFHADHVDGIERLVEKRQPRTIVAPYLTLLERLYFVSRLDPTQTGYANVLLQPAAWLRRIAPNARIVFIAPANPNDGGEGFVDGIPPNAPDSQDRSFPDWPGISASVSNGEDADVADSAAVVARTKAPLMVGNTWEFVFYNRPRPEMARKFQKLTKPMLDAFMQSARGAKDYANLIEDLRSVFNSIRGPANQRFLANEISLITYSGPSRRNPGELDAQPWLVPVGINPLRTRIGPGDWPPPFPTEAAPCGLLLTGDITFDATSFSDLTDRFTQKRLDYVRYFQVPHHGSKRSYLLPPSSGFSPAVAIFSSDRYQSQYDHPSSKVVRLFREETCFFVNEFQGLLVGGYTD